MPDLDFHPHLHALVADGLFTRDLSACGHAQAGGTFRSLPPLPLKPLEELFRANVLKLLVSLKLLPPERVQVLLSWKHSGFNVHAGDAVPPEHKAELEKLAHYILRNPFSVEKMTMESPCLRRALSSRRGRQATDTVIYRSRLNPKINRNFEVFTPTDFLAAITQHLGSANCEVRVSKQNRQRRSAKVPLLPEFVIRHSSFGIWLTPPPPAKLPSKKWRDLIQQVWHTDPLLCPQCQHPMRVIAVIDQRAVVEKILRHLGLWNGTPPLAPARAPPACARHADRPDADAGPWIREPCDDVDPMPDYENVLTD